MTNKSQKCRPPSSCLINSPPSDNKSPTWSPDSCTSLPLWLTQLGFSSFIFNPIFNSPPILLSTNNPSSHQFGWRTNAKPPPFVSNSDRHFVVLVIQLHLCSRIPKSRSRAAADRLPRTTGEVTPGSSGSVSVIFDRAPEKRGGRLSQYFHRGGTLSTFKRYYLIK